MRRVAALLLSALFATPVPAIDWFGKSAEQWQLRLSGALPVNQEDQSWSNRFLTIGVDGFWKPSEQCPVRTGIELAAGVAYEPDAAYLLTLRGLLRTPIGTVGGTSFFVDLGFGVAMTDVGAPATGAPSTFSPAPVSPQSGSNTSSGSTGQPSSTATFRTVESTT